MVGAVIAGLVMIILYLPVIIYSLGWFLS